MVFSLRKGLNQVSTPALPVVTSNTRPRSSTSTDSLASWGEVTVQIPFWNIFKIFSRICESLGSTPAGLTLRPLLVLPFRFYSFLSNPLDNLLPAGLSIADRFPRSHHSGVPCWRWRRRLHTAWSHWPHLITFHRSIFPESEVLLDLSLDGRQVRFMHTCMVLQCLSKKLGFFASFK